MARVQAEVASAGTRGAGPVIVAWKRCFCVGDQPGKGHRTVACRELGYGSVWYRPPHDPEWEPPG